MISYYREYIQLRCRAGPVEIQGVSRQWAAERLVGLNVGGGQDKIQ